ncbi:hypothetical protein QL374_001196 [Salmonella enterica]|nr:hypothetical protein [Salmonella enterica]ELW6560979.1 hypothetical protein [Salmonella enterica]ELZ1401912.1 hypothetical protein [Salmonella enterica]
MNSGKNKPPNTTFKNIKLKVRDIFSHISTDLRVQSNDEEERTSDTLKRKISVIPNIAVFCVVFIIFLTYYYFTKDLSMNSSKIGYIALYFIALSKVLEKTRKIIEGNSAKNSITRIIAEKAYNIDFWYKLIIVLLGLIGALVITHI